MKATLLEPAQADLTDIEIEHLSKVFKALSEPSRLKILRCLFAGEKCVTDIINSTGLLQANVSKQLKVLQSCGFLDSRAQGLLRYYTIRDYTILKICHVMCANGLNKN
ncbi:MAG: metalloregulator ArsR/SmtB family transcription factor [Candidatus Kapabacteria bacterium]|nr:metalloregulator ArsR/SmtB family transcription factor [Candidatus Kapabacteria bacterium]